MHAYQQTAFPKYPFVIFIYIVSCQTINLFYHEIPSSQVEIAYTEIYTFHSHIGNDTL